MIKGGAIGLSSDVLQFATERSDQFNGADYGQSQPARTQVDNNSRRTRASAWPERRR